MNTTSPRVADAIGRVHAVARADARIVSLVPSVTELLFELGAGDRLVGRTGFCVHPRALLRRIPKVGGTKDVDIARIRELAPTHVVVNIDENEQPAAAELARFVPHVIVTHPLAPHDNLPLYRMFGAIFRCEGRAQALCADFTRAYDEAVAACAGLPRQSVLYLIWRKPWMTVSRDTYISRTLALVGWDTLPAAARVRYPALELDTALLSAVDYVLLSSEPYSFRAPDIGVVQNLLPHAASCRVQLIDGEMTSWYGSRAIHGLRELGRLRASLG